MALWRGFVEKLGMYPQTVVPLGELHDILTANYAAQTNNVKATGASYTANKDNVAWNPDDNDPNYSQELNYEYSYNGAKYVKVTPYGRYTYNESTYPQYTYNNGEPLEQVTAAAGDAGHPLRWFKVEPIKWIVLNFNEYKDKINEAIGYQTEIDTLYVPEGATLELYAADVLMSGIQFNPESATQSIWDQSSIYKYLNIDFYSQAFSDTDKQQIQESTIYNNIKVGDTESNAIDDPTYNSNLNHFPDGGLNETIQKIYLLSYYELSHKDSPYVKNGIFNEGIEMLLSKTVFGTDYARAHYLYINPNGTSSYWSRTAGNSTSVYRMYTLAFGSKSPTAVHDGTRPALTIFCFAL